MKQLARAPVKRTMEAELTGHPGYEKHDQGKKSVTNQRNGKTIKDLRTDDGPIVIEVPRDREGLKGRLCPNIRGNEVSTEFRGFDDKILSMYADGHHERAEKPG
jgi:transposase-like protein